MPTVTKLEAQARRADRVNVFLDGAYAFSLTLDVAAGLAVGDRLDGPALERLRSEDDDRRALERALSQLGRRPRSRREVARYLADKGVPEDAVARVLERLVELGLLDDAAFASWWVENRLRHRPRGARALRHELAERGVGREDLGGAMAALDEPALARQVALAEARRYRGLSQAVFERRLGGLLARRGFDHEATRRAVAAAWAAQEPPEEAF
jgi:regulatory protein